MSYGASCHWGIDICFTSRLHELSDNSVVYKYFCCCITSGKHRLRKLMVSHTHASTKFSIFIVALLSICYATPTGLVAAWQLSYNSSKGCWNETSGTTSMYVSFTFVVRFWISKGCWKYVKWVHIICCGLTYVMYGLRLKLLWMCIV